MKWYGLLKQTFVPNVHILKTSSDLRIILTGKFPNHCKVFKNWLSKICRRLPWKNLKWYCLPWIICPKCFKISGKSKHFQKTQSFFCWSVYNFWCRIIFFNKKWQNLCSFKGTLSGLRQFLAAESLFEIMKNAFYFTSKVLFILKMFKFLSLVMYRNVLIKKKS